MPRILLKVFVFVCIVKLANSTEIDKTLEKAEALMPKSESKLDIIKIFVLNIGRFTRRLILPALLVMMFYLGFAAANLCAEGVSWASLASIPSHEVPALNTFLKQLAEYSPAYALAFAFLFWGTISFPISFLFNLIKSIFLLLVCGFLLSGAPLMKYMKGLTIPGYPLGTASYGWSIVSVFIVLLFPINMFENNLRSEEEELSRKNRILELQTSILAMKTTNSPTDEPKTLNSGTTETLLKETKKTENVSATEQKEKPKENVPAAKNAQKSQPKKAKEESKSINWVAWVPIVIASVFGLGIVAGIFYYKCRRTKSELRFESDPNDVAAMQNYETRRNTKNEFGQKF